MKKITQYTLPIILILFFISCRKDNNISNDYKTFDVHVQYFSTKGVVPNYNMYLDKVTWASNGRSNTDTILMFSKTDLNGNVTFKIPTQLIKDSARLFYNIGGYRDYLNTAPDSTSIQWKYFGSVEVYHLGNSNNKLIEVYPSCEIKATVSESDWNLLQIDSAFFQNKPFYESLIRSYFDKTYVRVECSSNNRIYYYYYSKGIKSKEYYKDIYVPFSSQDMDIKIIPFDFK